MNSKSLLVINFSKQLYNSNSIRCLATHWDPKFRKLRAAKVAKPKLFDMDEREEREEKVKRGVQPPIDFTYKPLMLTTSAEIFDPFVPQEGDGKLSVLEKSKALVSKVSKTVSKKFKHTKLINKHDKSFDENLFGEIAQSIYIDAHNSLMSCDPDIILNHVTEHALKIMTENMKFKTIRWKWIESLEQPVVQHIVTREMITKEEIFAQVTVRIHSKQILAVYDRFGRLAFGTDKLPKDVLEYVVFEKYLTSQYGSWRLHDKILPTWAPPKEFMLRSFVKPKPLEVDEEAIKRLDPKFKSDDSHLDKEKEETSALPPA